MMLAKIRGKIRIEANNIEDVKFLKFASESKFAEVWKEEKDGIWESYRMVMGHCCLNLKEKNDTRL